MSSVAEKWYRSFACANADDLLNMIDSRGPCFHGTLRPSRWIFRGQENVDWQLLPSAFRALPDGHTNRDQISMEFDGLCKFFNSADRSGLPLPEDSQATRSLLRQIRASLAVSLSTECHWPPNELLSILALAQHNGIPTRLLDWSWDARTAAYFAAVKVAGRIRSSSAGHPPVSSERICVWAISLEHIEPDDPRWGRTSLGWEDHGFFLVTAPSAGNANLRAQRGVFLLHKSASAIKLAPKFTCRPIEDKLVGSQIELLQFTLPTTESPRLMRLLARDGISGAALFPSYEGAAKAAQEEMLWDQTVVDGDEDNSEAPRVAQAPQRVTSAAPSE